jgi:hypothetical protein
MHIWWIEIGNVLVLHTVKSIPTAYSLSFVFKHGIKMREFVNKNEISDFPSADKVRRHRKHVFFSIQCIWHVLQLQKKSFTACF